jgi:hypothetical protein
VVTRSLKRGTIWRIHFQEKGRFSPENLDIVASWPFFASKKKKWRLLQTGSCPSAGKSLVVASHTSPTSSICYITESCIVSDTIHQTRWIDVIDSCLSKTEILVNICKRMLHTFFWDFFCKFCNISRGNC